jgi:hypothetical protein
MSELKIENGKRHLIVCFGGMAMQFGGILPFEFLTYLRSVYMDKCDLLFYIDKNQCWYHKGIDGITHHIDDTVLYLNDKIKTYEKVIFMGVSSGGYASILFGSLCTNVSHVIAFIPQTKLQYVFDQRYTDLKRFIRSNVKYILYGDTCDNSENHHISHCENIESFSNVRVERIEGIQMKLLRDTGVIQKEIDAILLANV